MKDEPRQCSYDTSSTSVILGQSQPFRSHTPPTRLTLLKNPPPATIKRVESFSHLCTYVSSFVPIDRDPRGGEGCVGALIVRPEGTRSETDIGL